MLVDDMLRRVALARPKSKKIGEKFNAYIRQLTLVSRQMMASLSELSLVQVIPSPISNYNILDSTIVKAIAYNYFAPKRLMSSLS